jgi:hypothetical protein
MEKGKRVRMEEDADKLNATLNDAHNIRSILYSANTGGLDPLASEALLPIYHQTTEICNTHKTYFEKMAYKEPKLQAEARNVGVYLDFTKQQWKLVAECILLFCKSSNMKLHSLEELAHLYKLVLKHTVV